MCQTYLSIAPGLCRCNDWQGVSSGQDSYSILLVLELGTDRCHAVLESCRLRAWRSEPYLATLYALASSWFDF